MNWKISYSNSVVFTIINLLIVTSGLLFLMPGCVPPQRVKQTIDDIDKVVAENTVNDDSTYGGIRLGGKADYTNLKFNKLDRSCNCKIYTTTQRLETFDFALIWTDLDDNILEIAFYKLFSNEQDASEFFSYSIKALREKYPKLRPFSKDIDDYYVVRFKNEALFREWYTTKSRSNYLFDSHDWYVNNYMIHPNLKSIGLSKNITDKVFVVLTYSSDELSKRRDEVSN